MKIGDLVRLSMRKTRKGRLYEDNIGVVTKVEHLIGIEVATERRVTAVFAGIPFTFSLSDLEVVSESR